MTWWLLVLVVIGAMIVVVAIIDVIQTKEPVVRNFPVVGHGRRLLSSAGPKLRQYIVAANDEERPFNRDQRRWVYDTAAAKNAYFGFGTDSTIDRHGHIIIKQSAFPDSTPIGDQAPLPCAKVIGEWRDRPGKFRPESVVYVSAMSFGSLSGRAVEAVNRGCSMAGALHNTGEGGISDHHRHGGPLVFQFGTGYFGCRNDDGTFSLDRLAETVGSADVRCIEIKLSQGAKPGLGGVLPAEKVTPEIAAARGLPVGQSVISPNRHSAFDDADSMIDLIECIADRTGLPVGIKSAVGQQDFWNALAARMAVRGEGPDFVTIDGGEGGTGAAPLAFSDHVSLPFRAGFTRAYRPFAEHGLQHHVVFGGAGKLGFPADAILAFALGADLIGVAREPMLALGCIQAQRCHDGHCPTGITTHNRWLTRGLVPEDKAERLANYIVGFRSELIKLSHACGVVHPALVTADMIEIFEEPHRWASAADVFGGGPQVPAIDHDQAVAVTEVMVDLGRNAP